jgi:hypothetical protein
LSLISKTYSKSNENLNLYVYLKECNTIDFDKEISYTEYLTDWYVDYMKNSLQSFSSQSNNTNAQIFNLNRAFQQNATSSSIRANIVSFNIYFNELTYNLISDSPQINWFSLFANLAGICGGSFLGMSFLAILEFLEYFFYMFFIIFKHGFLMLNSLIRKKWMGYKLKMRK